MATTIKGSQVRDFTITDDDVSPTAGIASGKIDLSNVTQEFKTQKWFHFITAVTLASVTDNNSLFLSSVDDRIHIKDNAGNDKVVAYLDETVGGGNVVLVSEYVVRETPSGAVNGVNVTYTLANTPEVGTEHVYLNGMLQDAGAVEDYTISGAIITFSNAPIVGDKIRVSYIVA